jgi:2'-5' RNA ligase
MPRLFISIDLPEDVRDRLAEIAVDLPGADWTQSDQYHLTLRFLGEVDEHRFQDIRQGLETIQARSFHLTLKGVGLFPLRGDPDVLWVGAPGNDELQSLRNKVESLVVRRGVERDSRKFHPHVTLARVGGSQPEWIGRYILEHSLFAIHEVPVQGFSLYSSRLTPGGAIHALEGAYPLEGILEAE